jgi:adenylyltransferase/sulfurtransferase
MQGLEVLKLITGVGSPLYNRLCLINGLDGTMRTLRFSPDPDNPLTGTQPTQKTLIDYAAFCGTAGPVRDLSPAELWALQSEGRLAALIDVRTEAEYADCNIGGIRLTIQEAAQRIPQTGIVVVHCHSGARSAAAIRQLQTQYGYTNLYNLAGGIAAWIAAGYPAIHTQTA